MNIIFKCQFGSHLYGTNTLSSDLDYKGVFISDIKDIILRRDKKVIIQSTNGDETRNTKDDIDIEFKDLREYLKDAMDGQTYALDMLFCTEDRTIQTSKEWEFIQANRMKLISKNIAPFIGYCRQQAGKYSLKGSRLAEIKRVLDIANRYNNEQRVADIIKDIELSEYVKIYEEKANDRFRGMKFLNILDKKYAFNIFIKTLKESLNQFWNKYGDRAREAMDNKGIDWKAISHAYRCMFELEELANTGEIKFPLKSAPYLLEVKQGKIDYKIISEELPLIINRSTEAVTNSNLPEKPNKGFWDNFILSVYESHNN